MWSIGVGGGELWETTWVPRQSCREPGRGLWLIPLFFFFFWPGVMERTGSTSSVQRWSFTLALRFMLLSSAPWLGKTMLHSDTTPRAVWCWSYKPPSSSSSSSSFVGVLIHFSHSSLASFLQHRTESEPEPTIIIIKLRMRTHVSSVAHNRGCWWFL